MPRIPESEIDRIKSTTDILALIQSRGVTLKQQGKNWTGFCPFHQDTKTPNLIVTPSKGLFRCMASHCGKTGNALHFVQFHDGVSFRHAFEILADGKAAFQKTHAAKYSREPKLPCPFDTESEESELLQRVAKYYANRLPNTPAALAYLKSRFLDDPDVSDDSPEAQSLKKMVETFGVGISDRTLGLRIPHARRKDGAILREKLKSLGVYRSNGREHLNGCLTIPITDLEGNTVQIYGRRIDPQAPKSMRHLYLSRPLAGIFNPDALKNNPTRELILTESIIDALTFYHHGMQAVTCTYGTENFPPELFNAIKAAKIQTIRIGYDNDKAGEHAFVRDAERFISHGIEVYRIRFPYGEDANSYAIAKGGESLKQAVRDAVWYSNPEEEKAKTLEVELAALRARPDPDPELETQMETALEAAKKKAQNRPPLAPVKSNSTVHLATNLVAKEEENLPQNGKSEEKTATLQLPIEAKNQASPPKNPCPSSVVQKERSTHSKLNTQNSTLERSDPQAPTSALEKKGDYHELTHGPRTYRIGGLEKNNSLEVLRITLRITTEGLMHVDSLDLYRDGERRKFITRAAEETLLEPDLIKRDLGKLLLALEQTQETRLNTPSDELEAVTLTPAEESEALELLKSPDLLTKITQAYDQAGIVGEQTNILAAYLACASRKLAKPLAVIIQSTSAAGKSALMEAVLSFFPPDEQIKYSAMTGQSLYYLGENNLKHKILAIVEEEGAEKASYALKLLQSEGELTIASTGKDPHSGRMETQEYHVEGPVAIMFTTTSIDIDEELMNRCLVLTVDESKEQTQRIHTLQREARTIEGILASEKRKDIIHTMQNAQRLIRPMKIANPYARHLTFTSGRTRTRRDHEKYLTLIDTIALLHQHQRDPITHTINGREVEMLPVTLSDIESANRIAPEVLGRSLDELPPQSRRLLESIKTLTRQKMETTAAEQHLSFFSRKELREKTGWSNMQIRRHLERLCDLEYIAQRGGRNGIQIKYELLTDANESAKSYHVGLLDVAKLRNKKPAINHTYNNHLATFTTRTLSPTLFQIPWGRFQTS